MLKYYSDIKYKVISEFFFLYLSKLQIKYNWYGDF